MSAIARRTPVENFTTPFPHSAEFQTGFVQSLRYHDQTSKSPQGVSGCRGQISMSVPTLHKVITGWHELLHRVRKPRPSCDDPAANNPLVAGTVVGSAMRHQSAQSRQSAGRHIASLMEEALGAPILGVKRVPEEGVVFASGTEEVLEHLSMRTRLTDHQPTGKRCEAEYCDKSAEEPTKFCIKHGGGRRCEHLDCEKATRGKSPFCVQHGGGKRCIHPGCPKSARGSTDHCVGHGGGKRCSEPDCGKSAQGSTDRCVAHGGGRRCEARPYPDGQPKNQPF